MLKYFSNTNGLQKLLVILLFLESAQLYGQRVWGEDRSGPQGLFDSEWAVGLQLGGGSQSGLSVALPWNRNSQYIQGAIDVSLFRGIVSMSGDFIHTLDEFFRIDPAVAYAGVGGFLHSGEDYNTMVSEADGDTHVGLRVPVGIYGVLQQAPVQLYFQLVPGLQLATDFNVVLSAEAGARWLF